MRRAVLASLAGSLLLVPSTSSALTEDCPFGVNAHQASNMALQQAAAAGIGWVRFDFNWFQIEPADNQFDWTIPDRFWNSFVLLSVRAPKLPVSHSLDGFSTASAPKFQAHHAHKHRCHGRL